MKVALIDNLKLLGYEEMTKIQSQSLPAILNNQDVIAQAKTGSGKTAAFGLGLLNKLDSKLFKIQTLVLCPTRELADQVASEIRRLARGIHNIKVLTLCGGVPLGPQKGSLEHGAHIIVGTPGRVADHLSRQTLNLEALNTLVLDEADRMLEMGFQETLDFIIEKLPTKRQTLLFSATFPDRIKSISANIMLNPIMVKVAEEHSNASIQQLFYQVSGTEGRIQALRLLLLSHRPASSIIFCNTKAETQDVADYLSDEGFSVLALHGDLEQKDRDRTLVQFSNKSISILVATDVAARGLDIADLDMVINYHMAHDTEIHTHRIGRTGRAGNKGIACTFFEQRNHRLEALEKLLGYSVETTKLPDIAKLDTEIYLPNMITLQIDGGKRDKLRPGDILGSITAEQELTAADVGRIQIYDNWSYVAVKRDIAHIAIKKLTLGKLKSKSFRARILHD